MPELPEVEILVRHLAPLLRGKIIRNVEVRRAKVIAPTTTRELRARLTGARFLHLRRRGKYLLFDLQRNRTAPFTCLGHLGMTGRMYLQSHAEVLPKHAALVLDLGALRFVYEDTRYFGRFTLDTSAATELGPEPLSDKFMPENFALGLKRSAQPIKVKLLDQSLVAGIGNIYASEALFRARLSPRRAARSLKQREVHALHREIRNVLQEAIDCGSTIPLDYAGRAAKDRLFYFGRAAEAPDFYEERLLVYDREDKPCMKCRAPIKRIVQAARSTFFCPKCQRQGG
jgi:formamidopyrimidine-DNA glycosylase